MSNIKKCAGKGCKKKRRCYRYLAPNSFWQSWITPDPKDCDYFIDEKEFKGNYSGEGWVTDTTYKEG